MLKVYLAIIAAVEFINLALLLWIPGVPLWIKAVEAVGVLLVATLAIFLVRHRIAAAYRRGQLSPDRLVSREASGHARELSPEELSRSIVERSGEIRRALDNSPSKVEAEMCALGYRACVNDMITLTNTINEQTPGASPLRKFRLRRAKKRSTEALSRAREALPEDALRATRQEQP